MQADQDGASSGPIRDPDPEQPTRVVESFRLCVPRQTRHSPSFRGRVCQPHSRWRLRQCKASCHLHPVLARNSCLCVGWYHECRFSSRVTFRLFALACFSGLASPMQARLAYRCALVLRDLVHPYLLRRQKKDLEDIIHLPAKTEQVQCQLGNRSTMDLRVYCFIFVTTSMVVVNSTEFAVDKGENSLPCFP